MRTVECRQEGSYLDRLGVEDDLRTLSPGLVGEIASLPLHMVCDQDDGIKGL